MMVRKTVERDEKGRITSVFEKHLDLFEELVEVTVPKIAENLRQAAARGDARPRLDVGPLPAGLVPREFGNALAARLGADRSLPVFKNGFTLEILPPPPDVDEVDDEDDDEDDDELDDDVDDDDA